MGKSGLFLYPDSNPDHSQSLMGSKSDQDPSFQKDAISSMYLILLRNKQQNGQINKTKTWIISLYPDSDPGYY